MRRSIVFVLPDFFAGGAQKVMISLASGLDRAKYDPAIVVVNAAGPWLERVPADIPVTDLGKKGLRGGLLALMSALRAARPDIVISTMGYLNLGVLALRPFLGQGTQIMVREANALVPEREGVLSLFGRKGAYRFLYPWAARVISPSQRIADELTGTFGVKGELIEILRNPVMVNEIRGNATPVRRQEGEGARFMCVGRLSRQKAYDRLLETLAAYDVDGCLTSLGEGPERAKLEAMIADLGLQERVSLAGFDANPAPWIAGADALLLPSLWEGLPNVALEALALGTPVIAAPEAGGIAEVAALASPGCVTVVPMGSGFADAMRNVAPRRCEALRASMLPAEFSAQSINAHFQSILDGCFPEAIHG